MRLYFNCSFRNSKLGYTISVYDFHTSTLASIGGDNEDSVPMPYICSDIFNHEVGRTMLLSTDENKKLIFSVLSLIEDNYEKYVNAIFCDDDESLIYRTFLFFCFNYKEANRIMLDSIRRADRDLLGYELKSNNVLELLYGRIVNMKCGVTTFQPLPSRQLIAFISEGCFEDYRLNVKEVYQNNDVEIYQIDASGAVPLDFIEHLNRKLGKGHDVSRTYFSVIFTVLAIVLIVLICIVVL